MTSGQTKRASKKLKLVALHLGVSNSLRDQDAAKQLAKKTCEEILSSDLTQEYSQTMRCCYPSLSGSNIDTSDGDLNLAELAVVRMVKKLEDHYSLNCGYGSNLNIDGVVECDASLMSDKSQSWTGVGALSGCKNPIEFVHSLKDHQKIFRPLRLVQPNFLVGSGARLWMKNHCPHLSIKDSRLISPKAFSRYQKVKSSYDAAIRHRNVDKSSLEVPTCEMKPSNYNDRESPTKLTQMSHKSIDSYPNGEPNCDIDICQIDSKKHDFDNPGEIFDTVGSVAVDCYNNYACAISSGGLLLKYKGRIGQAATPGAGCWAEQSVAVTTTGVGEYLTTSLFAKAFFNKISTLRLLHDLGHIKMGANDVSDLISNAIGDCFEDLFKSPALAHVSQTEKYAGLLSVCSMNTRDRPERFEGNDVYLSLAHNTKSMCIGYMTSDDVSGHSLVSHNTNDDGSVLIKTMKFSL